MTEGENKGWQSCTRMGIPRQDKASRRRGRNLPI